MIVLLYYRLNKLNNNNNNNLLSNISTIGHIVTNNLNFNISNKHE